MTDQNATPQFAGSYTALITPFADGRVDEAAFRKLVDWQIESGTNGLVPVGTTGESPTLSHGEHDRVIEICIEQAAGRVPVIAGAGSNSTAEAVRLAEHAATAGADAVLINTAIAVAKDPIGMSKAFSLSAKAGRAGFLSGLGSSRNTASASSPLTGFLK